MNIQYENAINYLNQIPSFAKKTSLDNVQCCLDNLGNPQKSLSFVHVAGTNGKGSTCVFLEGILRAQGVKTGVFLSPHVRKINERIRLGEHDISDDLFATCFDEVKQGVDIAIKKGGEHPSFFEFLFFMALIAFQKQKIEIGIIETGMGGRHDATNVLTPLVSVLTSISLDHMEFLGSTLEDIAYEKAGIIKPGVPVVYREENPDITKVIRGEISKKGGINQGISKDNLNFIDFSDKYEYDRDDLISIGLFGEFQQENATLAVKTARIICEECSIDSIKEGLGSPRLSGRMERLSDYLLVDGAHNIQGIQVFCQTIKDFFPGEKVVFYAPSHKNEREEILPLLEKLEGLIEVIEIPIENRQIDREVFAKAYEKLKVYTSQGKMCFCVGSFYLVGMVKSFWRIEE